MIRTAKYLLTLTGALLIASTADLFAQSEISREIVENHVNALAAAPKADSVNFFVRVTDFLGRQLAAPRSFYPAGNSFYLQAVKRFGPVRGTYISLDRHTRSGRIGMSGTNINLKSDDGFLHEGVEAYAFKPRKAFAPVQSIYEPAFIPDGPYDANADYDFVNYLIGNGYRADANAIVFASSYYAPSDTLTFLRGWAAYNSKDLDAATHYFSQVDATSPLYDKTLFYNVATLAHLQRYEEADALLESYSSDEYMPVRQLQRAGLRLLKGDQEGYSSVAKTLTGSNYATAEAEQVLAEIYHDRYEKCQKSPVLAAVMSTVVPGLGKIYAGNLGEGLSSLLTVGSFAAVTAECWAKQGFGDWRTITFGAIGLLFYIGNIYGSYFSVQHLNNYINDAQTTAILYNIHIPLRSVFR